MFKLPFILFTAVTLALPLSAHEHEEQLGNLVGDGLGLYYSDHAISGHVNGHLVFANPFDSEFGLKLSHRAGGKTYESDFKKGTKGFGGLIETEDAKGLKKTEILFTKVDAKAGVMEGMIGSTPFKVNVSATKMEGHHYVNPVFDVTLPSKTYSFRLNDGMACMGCSLKIVYVVLGMLSTTGTL